MYEVLTRGEAWLHGQLVGASLKAAAERWDVLLLSEGVALRKDRLYLSHVALLKSPIWEIKIRIQDVKLLQNIRYYIYEEPVVLRTCESCPEPPALFWQR